jgi:hypothetical protein
MDLRDIGLGGCGLDLTGSGQGPVAAVVNTVINMWVLGPRD